MDKLKLINIPMIAFLAFVARIVYFGASIGDSIAIIALGALYGYNTFLKNQKTTDVSAELKQEVEDIRNNINLLKTVKGIRSHDKQEPFRF